MLVGGRGGKTSLINCALKQCLSGAEVVRGEFSRRLVNAAEMRKLLRISSEPMTVGVSSRR